MKFEDFWYIVALSEQLKPNTVLSRTVLGEWSAVFRGDDGKPVVLRDRCMHRNSRLSKGNVCAGTLHCPYHGWVYDNMGQVVAVPAEGDNFKAIASRQAKRYATLEQDGYVYVRLAEEPSEEIQPFPMPYYGKPGWETVRVINRFRNNVTNCAENFIDIPHTASVHPGIFRKSCQQQLEMIVERKNGSVLVDYHKETTNLGWFSKFLNPRGGEIKHTDSFHMPNVTSVEYNMGTNRRLFITSQCIPEAEDSTLVYTDVTFNYGIWNKIARPFVRWAAQHIIHQDVEALGILFSAWLRLWGAKVGQNVYWTPRLEIADRGLIEIGDRVVFGYGIELYSHVIKPKNQDLMLYVKKVKIGSNVFLGAGSRLAPGVVLEDGTYLPVTTDLYLNQKAK